MDLHARLLDAIKAKDPKRVRSALAAGASLAMVDGKRSPLHAAAEAGNVEVLHELPRQSVRKLLNQPDSTDQTPLMYAALKDRREVARALLEMGADVNARNSTGETALRVTAASGTPEMARLLLEAGADPLMPGRMMLTPLDRARERRTPEGRMISAILTRAIEAKVQKTSENRRKGARKAPGRRNRASGGRKSKPARRRPYLGVE